MEPLILQTASEDAGKRLDAWLAEQTELTRSAVQKLMEEGRVTAAGKPLAKNTRLTGGKKTIINTNLSQEELCTRYSPQIASRLQGEYQTLRFYGQDIRLLKKNGGRRLPPSAAT